MYKLTVLVIDSNQLDELTDKLFNTTGFECSLESPNDTYKLYTNCGKSKLDKYELEYIEEMKKNNHCEYYHQRTLINALCDADLLQEGDYLVSVCW